MRFNALEHSALLRNLSPTRALLDKTPEEAWIGSKPDVSSLRVFSACVFVHIPDKHRDKLGAKSLVCTFLGYAAPPLDSDFRLHFRILSLLFSRLLTPWRHGHNSGTFHISRTAAMPWSSRSRLGHRYLHDAFFHTRCDASASSTSDSDTRTRFQLSLSCYIIL